MDGTLILIFLALGLIVVGLLVVGLVLAVIATIRAGRSRHRAAVRSIGIVTIVVCSIVLAGIAWPFLVQT